VDLAKVAPKGGVPPDVVAVQLLRCRAVDHNFDVVGIGNALVDVIAHHDDPFIAANHLEKGAMTLIDPARALELYAAMGPGVEMSGGSAANTMCGIASFGGRAGYIGKVADDQLGEVFAHDLRAVGVGFAQNLATVGVPTGRCLIVVTPDAERTMNTCLGVSELLGPDDVDEALVSSAKVLYMEGYLWDKPDAMDAYRKAARVAHGAGGTVSLTLSDSFCVSRHHRAFLDLIANEVDLLFANEIEICELFSTDRVEDAVGPLIEHCEMAAITLGSRGSMIVERSGVVTHVAVQEVKEVVDTTGAGDLYAAGFLYGYTQGAGVAECGRLGSVAAAEVISHVGARPLVSLAKLANAAVR
jgi:sugar/nucleoside kinase (ribokinase family)